MITLDLALTQREYQVCALLCDDLPNKAVAIELGLSVKTVEKYRESIQRKFGTSSPIGLYKQAVVHGYTKAPAAVATSAVFLVVPKGKPWKRKAVA